MRAEEVADLMNFHARKGVEFLFAMDFELQEALFIPHREQGGVVRDKGQRQCRQSAFAAV